jgi:hypothetical protein
MIVKSREIYAPYKKAILDIFKKKQLFEYTDKPL